ncbi:MAG TPA: VOC family protein [Rhizomicrobium sp.]|jgi:uncharacterized glyoxalase superfamily protein PhnB|nr:VOC family protein [Rhizomicrobium sp.]
MTTETVSPAPAEVRSGVAPYLIVENSVTAAEFYKKALNATVASLLPSENGKTMHCHLYVNGGSLMMSDAFPEHGHPWEAPAGFNLHLQVTDIESWYKRATDAGMTIVLPLQKMFWGDFYAQVKDPFGVIWTMGETPKA